MQRHNPILGLVKVGLLNSGDQLVEDLQALEGSLKESP